MPTARVPDRHNRRMQISEDGPWTAAAQRTDDAGEARGETGGILQHGRADDGRSLCGLAATRLEASRHPFTGVGPDDCDDCAVQLFTLAVAQGWTPHDLGDAR